MTTYNTGNPIGSTDPRDLYDNAQNYDFALNSLTEAIWLDRFGVGRRTWYGLEVMVADAAASYGIITLSGVSFTTGATVNLNEALLNTANNTYYKWTGSFPAGGKVVPSSSTPESTGGIGPGKWLSVGDTALRNDLAATGGVNLVNGAAKQSDLDALSDYVSEALPYNGKTAATWGKTLQSGTTLNIKCFGDSTMWGAMANNVAVQSTNNPPKMLKEVLLNLSGVNNNIINYAISGSTLYDMLRGTDGSGKTYQQRLTESPCDVVYCNHGINDNQTNKDLLQYRNDLIDFVKISRKNNATPVLVTPNPQTTIQLGTPTKSKRFPLFVNVMKSVAKDMSVDIVDNNYFMSKSLNVYNINLLFPDGVHLSDAAYRQYGYNLAIPLITCHSLELDGDVAGLNGALWYTNSTNSQISQQGSRCGEIISWEKEGNPTGINYPVVLLRGMKSICINQLVWGSSSRANAYINGASAGMVYPNKNLGNTSTLDWDSVTKLNVNCFAGLNVIGLLIDTSSPSIGTGMSFAGVVIPGGSVASMTSVSGDYYSNETLCNGDFISFNYNFSDGTECYVADKSGGKVASIKLNGSTVRAAIFKDNAEISGLNLATSVTPGIYQVIFRINDNAMQFFFGAATGTISTTSTLSNLQLKASSASFALVRGL